ncbi:MAG: acetate--CoA ligase family protein, partial [Acidimicrobiales bacterium]
ADISGNDLLRWWEQDPATDVVLMYLESFGNPRQFSRIATRLSRSKPIVAVKSGRSPAGTRGAASHTAALASPEEAVDALFLKTGVVRVDTIEEMFDVAQVLSDCPLPAGSRVGIVTNAGGPGVLAADALTGAGLEVPELSDATRAELGAFLDPSAGTLNPVDMIASASADTYVQTLRLLLRTDDVDSLLVIFTPPLVTRADDVATAVVQAVDEGRRAGCSKPVIACFLGSEGSPNVLHAKRVSVPCFVYPETAARALAKAVSYSKWLARLPGSEPVLDRTDANAARHLIQATLEPARALDRSRVATTVPGDAVSKGEVNGGEVSAAGWLTGQSAMALLDCYGIPTVPTIAVASPEYAEKSSLELGFPVTLKATGGAIVHKSDVGGVKLRLSSPEEVHSAYMAMKRCLGEAMEGAVLQRMVDPGVETIAGFVRDRAFGPLVLFGLGGTAVEVLGDHATRLTPLTLADARELVLSLRGSKLLTGFRGSKPVDLDALVDLVIRLGRLAEDLPELAEADCNPVMAGPGGAVVVDARLRVDADWTNTSTEARHLA